MQYLLMHIVRRQYLFLLEELSKNIQLTFMPSE